ncbi:MAG: hypothetical protein M1825_001373 [Sarcosagium campestre]|nr:MAG: hypothetical protein M1825_001373 [Sarcosagium campestre]
MARRDIDAGAFPPDAEEKVSPYLKLISTSLDRYPNLIFLHQTLNFSRFRNDGRAAVLEFYDHAVERREFTSPVDLRNYIEQTAAATTAPTARSSGDSAAQAHTASCIRRLYLLEGLPVQYVELFGSHFRIDPYVFARQSRTANWESGNYIGNTPKLPSLRPALGSFALRYSELRLFDHGIKNYELRCANQDRKISVTRLKDRFDDVGVVRRMASFWSKKLDGAAAGGWNALLMVDPPVGDMFQVGEGAAAQVQRLSNQALHGGYIDFSPMYDDNDDDDDENDEGGSDDGKQTKGPLRTSTFDDICFYWQRQSAARLNGMGLEDPEVAAIFIKRIVASNWMLLIQYLNRILSMLEFGLSRRKDLAGFSWLDQGWSDVQSWMRRCAEFSEHIDSTLDSLRIPLPDRGGAKASSETRQGRDSLDACTGDFLYIHRRMLELYRRTETLAASLTGLISILESKRSLEEARSLKTLTLLGMVFVPLAFTSGMFSMSGDYLPGKRKFWVYIAVAIPLILAVFAIAFIITYWDVITAAARPGLDQGPKRREKPRAKTLV